MILRRLIHSDAGASAAEFAMVLPLLLALLFGIIDAGRFAWEYNRAEKATQVGARVAVVTDPIAGGLSTVKFVGIGGLTQGDRIPASALPTMTCSSTACACTGCPTGLPGTFNTAAFTYVVERMQYMKPDITASNVTVEYRGSGLGYAGDPNGSDVSPLVTVKLSGVTFTPLVFSTFKNMTIPMPSFQTSLTAEDLSGSVSN